MVKAGSDCCNLPLQKKTHTEEVTLDAAKEISVDAEGVCIIITGWHFPGILVSWFNAGGKKSEMSAFNVICPLSNVSYGLFSRWIYEISPMHLGNVPSGVFF